MADTHDLALEAEKHEVVQLVHAALTQTHDGAVRQLLKHGFDVVGGAYGLGHQELGKKRSAEHCSGKIDEHAGCLKRDQVGNC